MSTRIDLTTTETAPFEAALGHTLINAFVGLWSGPTKLWLDPAGAPEETHTTLHAEPVLGGRWLRLSYRGISFGKPHAGEMLLGFHKDAGEFELAWIDSAHTGSAIMLSKGKPGSPGVVDVLGSYLGGGERWGWRTVFSLGGAGVTQGPPPDELVIEAFNVSPGGAEERAMLSRLTRDPP
jgi:hypothetical protein